MVIFSRSSRAMFEPKEGDKVLVNYNDQGFWEPGVIKKVNADGTVDIEYDDGDTEEGVATNKVKEWAEEEESDGDNDQGAPYTAGITTKAEMNAALPSSGSGTPMWDFGAGRMCFCFSIRAVVETAYDDLDQSVKSIQACHCNLKWHASLFSNADSCADGVIMLCTFSLIEDRGGSDILSELLSALDMVKEIELLMSAPCLVPLLRRHCLAQLTVTGNCNQDITLFHQTGLVVMQQTATADKLARLREASSARIAQADVALKEKHPEISVGDDMFSFKEMSSRHRHRFDLVFGNDAGGDCVRAFAASAPWVPLVRHLLSGNMNADFEEATANEAITAEEPLCCDCSVVYSRPGADNQDWHCDGGHLGADAGWEDEGSEPMAQPYAVCVFLALCDLDTTVGYTQFWLGSHKQKGLLGFGPAASVVGGDFDGLVQAGGCVVYDYRTMHRGIENKSEATERALLQFVYHVPSYIESKNYGTSSLFAE
jgi:hypothetical protein